jgi:hypothetical protein
MDGWLFSLGQDYRIYRHEIDKPNLRFQSVGVEDAPDTTGFRWDALWPGDPRPCWQCEAGDDAWKLWDSPSFQPIDMVAYNSGNYPQLVVSYLKHNEVQWRDPWSGERLERATVQAPKGVAFDQAGNLLVISANQVLKFSQPGKTPRVFIDGLTSPYRLDVDRSNGDILVAEREPSHQVKRFSSTGTLLNTYGKLGGRSRGGRYDPKEGFMGIQDIAAEPGGNFLVVEDENQSPRRVARVNRNGEVIQEWYASSVWTSYISPDPEDPSTVWFEHADGHLSKAKVDFNSRTWKLDATFPSFLDIEDTPQAKDAYDNGFRIRKHGGLTYVVNEERSQLAVMRVDEAAGRLKPCTIVDYGGGYGTDGIEHPALVWSDVNGDGLQQPEEMTRYRGFAWWPWGRGYFRSDTNLNFVGFSQINGKLYRVNVIGWTPAGCPVYQDLREVETRSSVDSVGNENKGWAMLAPQVDGNVFGVFDVDLKDWNKPSSTWVIRWNQKGEIDWWLNNKNQDPSFDQRHNPPPAGKVYAFRQVVGVTHDAVIANDYNGGWDGDQRAITYVWDKDGLWVGGLFENVDLNAAPDYLYTLSSDNRSGDIWTDPATGDVYFYGAWDTDFRIYKITGWNDWVRLSGTVESNR